MIDLTDAVLVSSTPLKKEGEVFTCTKTYKYSYTDVQMEEMKKTLLAKKTAEQNRDSARIISDADTKLAEITAAKRV